MTSNYIVKELGEKHLLDVAKLDAEVWLTAYNKNFSKKFLKERLANAEKTKEQLLKSLKENKEFFIGAFEKDELIGYVSYKKSDNLKHINDGMISNLYVNENHQNNGVGTLLFKEALIKIKEKLNKQNIIINVLKGNSNALRFFKSFGGDIIGTNMTKIDGKSIREYLIYIENIDKVLDRIENKEFIR